MALTYRDLGNGEFEINRDGLRIPGVRVSRAQLETAGYTEEPSMGGLEGAGYEPEPMPTRPQFAGPGAAEPQMQLSTSPLRVETDWDSPPPVATPAPTTEAEKVQQMVAPYGGSLAVRPPPSAVERLGSIRAAEKQVVSPEVSAIEKITGVGQTREVPGTDLPGAVVPLSETPEQRVRRIQLETAPEAKIKTTGNMPGLEEEQGQKVGNLPVILSRGGGGGKGPAPGTMVPGKEEIEFTRQDPEAMARMQKAMELQSQAVAFRLRRTSQQHAEYATTLEKEAKDLGDLGKMQQARYNRALAEFEAERASIASEQIDPGKYYTDRGIVGTILAAIMRGAGEWAAVKDRSGRNPVAQIIDNGVDREIDAQKANHAARMQGLSTKMTILDRYMENNDPKDAIAMARSNLKEAWVQKLAASGDEAAAAEVQASARRDIAEIEAKAGMQKVSTTLVPVKATGGGGGGSVPFQALVDATGYTPAQAMAYAQADPAGARKIAMQYLETQATARGKSEGGPGVSRPYATEAAKNLSLAEQLEKQTAVLEQAYRKGGRTAVVQALTPGTELYDARVKAAEALGRLHSGAAITKVEEERFAGMMGGKRHLVGGGDLAAKSVAQVRAEAKAMIEKLRKSPSEPGYPERPPPTSM